MITVFFNENGYCIAGEGTEVSRRCSPALTDGGDTIFQSIHHTYKILYLALCEIRDMSVQENVMVFNDSRIIDEVNRNTEPFDELCDEWLKVLQRHIIPSIRSVVFFCKKPTHQINETIAGSHSDMLIKLDPKTREKIAQVETQAKKAIENTRKRQAVERLKQAWLKNE